MTVRFSPMIVGAGAVLIWTGLKRARSQAAFAAACREIVKRHEGHQAHKKLDGLVTVLLSSLGYGEGMAEFIENVTPYHDECRP